MLINQPDSRNKNTYDETSLGLYKLFVFNSCRTSIISDVGVVSMGDESCVIYPSMCCEIK